MLKHRIRKLHAKPAIQGNCIIYIMSRDQRVQDNHALLAAQKHAIHEKLPLIVFFNLYTKLGIRIFQQYEFMIEGLKEVEKKLIALNIPFMIKAGDAYENITQFVADYRPSALYFDFSPLRESQTLKGKIAEYVDIPCFEVDTHNIIPVWITSPKEEFAAYTIRPKIHKLLPQWLEEPEQMQKHPHLCLMPLLKPNWEKLISQIEAPKIEGYNPSFQPGEDAAHATFKEFITKKLEKYDELRNDPSKDYQSHMSPYLHFGHISSLRIALEVNKLHEKSFKQSIDAFLEELIIRKELSDNFCFYNKNYDNFDGIKTWAKETLLNHIHDPREHLYTREQLEHAQTFDPAWNAAQKQLTKTGKIHGYMRMYWAKKILEWTQSPAQAIEYAVYLNDRYSLDGYEPNGYVGILWSIGGIHDRAWFERAIFGKIRYMNFNGLKRKFDIQTYIDTWQ